MKKIRFILSLCIISLLFFSFTNTDNALTGAWKKDNAVILFTKNYFSITHFDANKKVFERTMGGTYTIMDNTIEQKIEFAYPDTQMVGQTLKIAFNLKNGQLSYQNQGKMEVWEKMPDDGSTPLSHLWQIVGRAQQDGSMGEIKKGARKTVKIMTNNRFQWIALNTQTKAFSGTGGGTYTLKDGKYTETIEFFSRDNTRVGASLVFDAKVEGNKWIHTGKSSKGDPVHEIWESQD
jgi:hypothetical protein